MSDFKDYVDLKVDELKLQATKGFSVALGRLTTTLLLVALLCLVLALLSVVLIQWLGVLTGSLAVSSSIVCGVFLLVFIGLYLMRRRLFRDTFVKMFVQIFFGDGKE